MTAGRSSTPPTSPSGSAAPASPGPFAQLTVPELITASKTAFDNRRYIQADSLAEAACTRLSAAGVAIPA